LELLVAAAAVAVLATLALAGTGQAGFDARRLLCLENLRRLAAASILYATDNRDYLPHPSWGTIGVRSGPVNWCYATYLEGRGRIRSAFGWPDNSWQLPFQQAGQLWPYLGNSEVFRCPEDVLLAEGSLRSSWLQRHGKLSSFVMNGAVIDYGRLPGSLVVTASRAAPTQPLSRFAPGAWLFWEPDEQMPFSYNDAANLPHEGFSGRHGLNLPVARTYENMANGSHLGLFDGSARFVSIQEFYDESGGLIERGPRFRPRVLPNRAWCAPDSPEGGFF
jgi:hypothetical protein